jgi:hypothetical protein
MNDENLACLGERLIEKATEHADLLRFMMRHASAEVWAKAEAAGLTPSVGEWLMFMNQHRIKRAATKAEAEEIVRLVQVLYGDDSESILEWSRHIAFDPLWALHNLNHLARFNGQIGEI